MDSSYYSIETRYAIAHPSAGLPKPTTTTDDSLIQSVNQSVTMEAAAQTFLRPAAAAAAARGCLKSGTRHTLKQQIRTKATSARTRRSLNLPPHPTFLAADSHLQQDHIIFNPPAAAPSVYHTPFKFLPKTDPRRRANLASLFESHFASPSPGSASAAGPDAKIEDLPTVRASDRRSRGVSSIAARGPVTKAEVEEMRRLREEDAHKWSVTALADKFDLPRGFVMACCQAPKDKLEFERKKIELIQKRWGPIRAKAREQKERRKDMLYRGEI